MLLRTDCNAYIFGGNSTYVPLRFITEALRATITWKPDEYMAVVDTVE
ncbi:stalk domain-containing protein [Paenibacillus sp. NRS-1782]